MTSSRPGASLYIQCWSCSFAATRSIVLFTPNGLPQRMQQNGCSSLRMRADAVAARKLSCGFSVMTFSGQVALHNPHCTQASSAKRSVGRSGSSVSAPVGQADTQERHSVHPATSISIDPNGARSGRSMTSTGAGATPCNSRRMVRSTARLAPDGTKVAGRGAGGIAGIARNATPSCSGSSVSMVSTRPAPKPSPRRIGSARARVRVSPVTSWRGRARNSRRTVEAP